MATTRPAPPTPPPTRREQCITCAYPLDADLDILSVLSRVKGMMAHVGYQVDRLLIDNARDAPRMSVTLDLSPATRKRTRPSSPRHSSDHPPGKRPSSHRNNTPPCRLCASSCCSTNSLCKANVCGHRAEEESPPPPPPPRRATATTAPAGAAYDAVRAHPIGTVDFPAAPAHQHQQRHQQQHHPRTSPLSRLTSSEHRDPADPRPAPAPPADPPDPAPAKADAGERPAPSPGQAYREPGELRPPPELLCRPCAVPFDTELDLRKHQFAHHKDDKMGTRTPEGRFLCLMHSCQTSFVRRHVMERHFKTVHMMVREFPCSSCDKSFADSSTREAHRSAVHEKRKPWVCDQCSSCFTQSSSLGKHRRRFHQETVATSSQKQ